MQAVLSSRNAEILVSKQDFPLGTNACGSLRRTQVRRRSSYKANPTKPQPAIPSWVLWTRKGSSSLGAENGWTFIPTPTISHWTRSPRKGVLWGKLVLCSREMPQNESCTLKLFTEHSQKLGKPSPGGEFLKVTVLCLSQTTTQTHFFI